MNKEALEKKREAIRNSFSALETRRKELDSQRTDVNSEMLRLEGEFRVVDKLINEVGDGTGNKSSTKTK